MLGLVHIYTGTGKGKTTASMGLIIRALGAGYKVALVQFDKGFDGVSEHYNERHILRKLPGISLHLTGCERIRPDGTFRFGNTEDDLKEAKKGLDIARRLIAEGDYFLVVLDEILAAAAYGLLAREDVMELLKLHRRHGKCELALTGHIAWPELIDQADLVSDIRKVKHYYDKGVPARKGIEY